jgi:hypothetical protein
MVVGFTTTYAKQCLSALMLWVQISIRTRGTTLCDKVCQWLATGWWFSPGSPVSSTNKTDRHDITEILLKLALNTIKQTNNAKMYIHLYIYCNKIHQSRQLVKKWYCKYILSLNCVWGMDFSEQYCLEGES